MDRHRQLHAIDTKMRNDGKLLESLYKGWILKTHKDKVDTWSEYAYAKAVARDMQMRGIWEEFEQCEEMFGTILASMFTLFQVITSKSARLRERHLIPGNGAKGSARTPRRTFAEAWRILLLLAL